MKVWEVQSKEGLDALTLVERPEPQPKAGQVLLKMRAASLNYRDLLTVKGAYGSKQKLPFVPFSDGVGEVVAVGDGVTRVKVGDRVAGIFMQTWLEGEFSADKSKSALGGAIDGILAEYVTLHEDGVVHVPEHLSDEEAASLPCAAVTAWNALTTDGKLKAGDTVLVQGTGGVSLFALQFAKIIGAQVIATSSSDLKLDKLKQLGASEVINYKTTSNWDEKVWELTNEVGVDRIIEVGGAGTFNKSLRAIRYGGYISLIGVLTGLSADVSTASILHKGITVQGIYVGSRAMFEAMNRAIALHNIKPIIDRVFPFEEARQALEYMESGAHFGKIALHF
ncbi:alcohol dehydrogenase [Scytonema sp. HK-05]|uniref:zinc-dependent alcohol dehydrogenase family protein n=1 Tax=Scytonema sp. HK-05 TaxID=1137095 RepID=UPI000937F55E|nr:NAD(P)-dependent alcohol dehydrogenase [Scytonema sp. HK-05]OKH53812.1 NAD(P)-dependent alcohol dehydrogenase [Scytonema sp. HK-05]BAY45245.1 alcohol dehydrogenase [Scytonema sp. HK-05]